MFLIDHEDTRPDYNLAMEQYVFDTFDRDKEYFMLWRNDRAVIVGKHQNTVEEINQDYVREHGIQVVRRLSGGGAVYHDLGNLNFTYIVDAGDASRLDLRLFCEPVAAALKRLGIDAEVNGRNDITIAGRKFSGNSQYISGGRLMHHGTILFDSDLEVVNKALSVSRDKVESKGIKSVRSRVTNISEHLGEDVTLEQFKVLLVESMFDGTRMEQYQFTPSDHEAIQRLRDERYATWEWNFGSSPACSIRKKRRIEGCGTIEICMNIDGGSVTDMKFYGDFFSAADPSGLAEKLIGVRAHLDDYSAALEDIAVERYFNNLTKTDFLKLLT